MLQVDSHVGDRMVPFASIGCIAFVQTKNIISESVCFNPFKLDIFLSSAAKRVYGFAVFCWVTLLPGTRAESLVATLLNPSRKFRS